MMHYRPTVKREVVRNMPNSETGNSAEKAYNPATESTVVQELRLSANSETGITGERERTLRCMLPTPMGAGGTLRSMPPSPPPMGAGMTVLNMPPAHPREQE